MAQGPCARWRWLALALCLALPGWACRSPMTGPPTSSAARIVVTGASVDPGRHVVVSYSIQRNGVGASLAVATGVQPAWTLAGLGVEPVTGLPAWRSYLLLGADVIPRLPVAGVGTPEPFVLQGTRQPWYEDGGEVRDQGGGNFTYTFATPLPEKYDRGQTLRVGVWLRGVTPGTSDTSSTFDFVPGGGPVQVRELVLDENCNHCHQLRQGHAGSRTGWKLCVTCHTYQNADPDTVNPAAMAGATPATDPNPLEFGRLIHNVHRGGNLPTLYRSNWTDPTPARPYAANQIPMPYSPPPVPGLTPRNTPLPGSKYSVIDNLNGMGEMVFGAIVERGGNGQPSQPVTTGLVQFPQDYRNCDACHANAAQRGEIFTAISRRTCQGCHPDVWHGEGGTDERHFPHAGGPRADDTQCAGCHVAGPSLQVPIAEVHVPPYRSPKYSPLRIDLLSIENMKPGLHPTVRFRVSDRNGPILSMYAPTPATDPVSGIPRFLDRMALVLSGPSREYDTRNNFGVERWLGSGFDFRPPLGVWPYADVAPSWEYVWWGWVADADGAFTYTFVAALPPGASGTWAVGIHVSRGEDTFTQFYDPATDRFLWPYTGERALETAPEVVAYVDLAAGRLGAGNPAPRRKVVDFQKCNQCHDRLAMHDMRTNQEFCVMCHGGGTTDWNRRPKDASGNTDLSQVLSPSLWGTLDDIEERSVHFKVLMHRIHTGARVGTASMGLSQPLTAYGWPGGADQAIFYDEITMPRDLSDCAMCHNGPTYEIENVLPGLQQPTLANETDDRLHAGTAVHAAIEPSTPPIQAACRGCHNTRANVSHTSLYTTVEGVEQCMPCHGRNGTSALTVGHAITEE